MSFLNMYVNGFSKAAQSLHISKNGVIAITALGKDQIDSNILASDVQRPHGLAFDTSELTGMKFCQTKLIRPQGMMGNTQPTTCILQPFEVDTKGYQGIYGSLSKDRKLILQSMLSPFIDLVLNSTIDVAAECEVDLETSDSKTRLPPRPLIVCVFRRDEKVNPLGAALEKALLKHLEGKHWKGELIPTGQPEFSQDKRFGPFYPTVGVFYK